MKKSVIALFFGLVILSSSCSYQVCPTYAKAPVEKPAVDTQDEVKRDIAS